jgi:hypothetical protein
MSNWVVRYYRYIEENSPAMRRQHGRLLFTTKRDAKAFAQGYDSATHWAEVHHPKTSRTIAEFGNFNCFDEKTHATWSKKQCA